MIRRLVLALGALQLAAAARVAIIGAGMEGAASAMFLRDLVPDTDLEIFEMRDRFGGRLRHEEVEGHVIEVGGTLIYDGNRYVCDLAERVGVRMVPPVNAANALGIWDGEAFAFEQSAWGKYASLAKMLWRWGYSHLGALDAFVWQTLGQFNEVYTLQGAGSERSFERPEELWGALGLLEMTQQTFGAFVAAELGQEGAPLAEELMAAVNRVNYNQGNELNALAGAISMCPLVTGDVVVTDCGNAELTRRLAEASGAAVHLSTRVAAVGRAPAGGYELEAADGRRFGPFDAVVVATPLEFAPIAFPGLGEAPAGRPYRSTHATFVKGTVRPSYFAQREAPVPDTVLLAAAADEPFSSLASYLTYPDGDKLFKLFSPLPLEPELLGRLFAPGWTQVAHEPWSAYPVFQPPERFSSFRLFEGEDVFYPSALETGAAAMEISAVAARNAALLVREALSRTPPPASPPSPPSPAAPPSPPSPEL